MHRGPDSEPIPIDLILEILSRSSAKSVARFRFGSKFCASLLNSRPDFTELFLTKSSARPRLFFAFKRDHKCHFYSSPQTQNPDENSSLVVATDTHMKPPRDVSSEICGPVSGLIYFPNVHFSKTNVTKLSVIYNPGTGQYTSLPIPRNSRSFLGYDPIDKQFKVLSISRPLYDGDDEKNQILTLGTGKEVSWRKVECRFHDPLSEEGICINGVVYYFARTCGENPTVILACFDVRSEKLWFLGNNAIPPSSTKLVNYKGKLGVVGSIWYHDCSVGRHDVELCLWVLEDAEKQEWSNQAFSLEKFFEGPSVHVRVDVVGVTSAGEIVFSMMSYTFKLFYVFYFNPEKNTLKRVEIQGFEASGTPRRVHTFVDYVEDHKFI